jgi:GNAT superfamily N-acetyltransferase
MCDNSRECRAAKAQAFGTLPICAVARRDVPAPASAPAKQSAAASAAVSPGGGRREIRPVRDDEFAEMLGIINDAAQVYCGVIPDDRWHDPYMPADHLRAEIAAGVRFFGYDLDGELLGVMGIQDVDDVTLIRHAYVRPSAQRGGVGGRLLRSLLAKATAPVLIGTWADASWAVAFYEKHGFSVVSPSEKTRLLRRYWDIPERQVETSVVLAEDARAQR